MTNDSRNFEITLTPTLSRNTGRGSEKFGFALAIAIIALFAATKVIVADTLDPDLFWHLKVAEQLQRDGIGPIVDQMSFNSQRDPWTPYSWLAELGMKRLWDAGGYRAVVATQAVVEGLLVIVIALCCRQLAPKRWMECIVATALAVYLSLAYLSFRPATFGIFILAVVAWLLLRDLRLGQKSRAVWLIVPLTVLLTNVHLMVVLVPMWIACQLIAALLPSQFSIFNFQFSICNALKNDNCKLPIANCKSRYALLLLLTTLASLATPMLFGAVRTAIHYQFSDVMVASEVISEMQPFWKSSMGWITGVVLALMVWCYWRKRSELSLGIFLWIALAAIFMLRLGRFMPMFAIIACPALAATMPRLSSRVLGKQVILAALSIVVLTVSIRLATQFPRANQSLATWINRNAPDVAPYPCAAADFVAAHIPRSSGRIVNEFNWGGYLEWRLGGRYQTLLDGRTQLFAADFWRSTYLGSDAQLQRALTSARADAAIIPARKSHFADALKSLGWRNVYSDSQAEVLVPPASIADDRD